ncbi:MAG: E3 binding domain-containing protein, partial [Candidatus Dormiibacterota bacterium]
MPDVNMPKLSDTMEEGTIVEWKKKSGDDVKTGDVLAEVESDKATFDLEAEADGVLAILVEQGVPAKIGAPIARIGEASAATPAKQAAPARPAAQPKPKEPEPPPQVVEELQPVATSSPPAQAPAGVSPEGPEDGQHLKASPLAKRLAAEMGVDLAAIKGSGPDGRIVKEDVQAAASSQSKTERPRPPAVARKPAGPD